jgi:phosphate transport system substrate-binding protein
MLVLLLCGGGSGVGITAMIDTTDIAMASRELKTEEKMKFADEKVEIEQVIIAYDALTVIVNPANSVSKLTRATRANLYRSNQKTGSSGADEK